MLIKYGTTQLTIDITDICYSKLVRNNIICIPSTDSCRTRYFGDPIYGVLKSIFIDNIEYKSDISIYIDLATNNINTISDTIFIDKLTNIQKSLNLEFGSFKDEYPEQLMAVTYLTGCEKVLEIGGNIGRNSLIIASILNKQNNYNFVSLESSNDISKKLVYNKDINNLTFHVESSALSKRNLIQKNWDTIVSDIVLDGYTKVNTITLEQLYSKYNIMFDTLVLDCEGAFYYILMDMPEILNNIKLIIMENDYHDINNKNYVDSVLLDNGFYVDYFRDGGWGPCYNRFFEVWKK